MQTNDNHSHDICPLELFPTEYQNSLMRTFIYSKTQSVKPRLTITYYQNNALPHFHPDVARNALRVYVRGYNITSLIGVYTVVPIIFSSIYKGYLCGDHLKMLIQWVLLVSEDSICAQEFLLIFSLIESFHHSRKLMRYSDVHPRKPD